MVLDARLVQQMIARVATMARVRTMMKATRASAGVAIRACATVLQAPLVRQMKAIVTLRALIDIVRGALFAAFVSFAILAGTGVLFARYPGVLPIKHSMKAHVALRANMVAMHQANSFVPVELDQKIIFRDTLSVIGARFPFSISA